VQVKEVYQEKIAMTVEAMPVRVRVKKKVIMKRRAKLLQDHKVHRGLGGAINTKIEESSVLIIRGSTRPSPILVRKGNRIDCKCL
jgi:hypothetical protein